MTKETRAPEAKTFIRFDVLQRAQHFIFLISFTLLGLTGLPQKFPEAPISVWFFKVLGGIETARLIHHSSAIVMMIVSIFHVLDVTYRVFVLRTPISMIPWISDVKHVYEDVLYYLGLRKHKAYYGHYTYAEKVEYLALIWGTIIMGLTGFVMWNPISTLHILPGEAVPAAKAAHGSEAILAVLAIIIWHFYHVHIKHLNLSMFTGKMSEQEMKHEHPAELAQIHAGSQEAPIPAAVLRKRQIIFLPIAIVILAFFSLGFYYFVGHEKTAVVPNFQPTVPIYVPQTPTPQPTATFTAIPTLTATPAPTSTLAAAAESSSDSATPIPVTSVTWNGIIGPLFAQKCLTCHGSTASGGLSLATYADAMKGGDLGMAFMPGDAADSLVIQKFQSGDHPYAALTDDELQLIMAWLAAGAPEQ